MDFDRPELVLPGLGLRIGPRSSVVLTTSYLDASVRLGRGSRGSRFVFVKGGEADAAGGWLAGRTMHLHCRYWAAQDLHVLGGGILVAIGHAQGVRHGFRAQAWTRSA